MAYQSNYQSEIDSILNELRDMRFEYNAEKDPVYKQYETEFNRKKDVAIDRLFAKINSLTGGRTSSYAASAAAATANDYTAQSAAVMVDLYDNAQRKYSADRDNLVNYAKVLAGLDNEQYNRYLSDQKAAAEQSAKAAKASSSGSGSSSSSSSASSGSASNANALNAIKNEALGLYNANLKQMQKAGVGAQTSTARAKQAVKSYLLGKLTPIEAEKVYLALGF